MPKAEIKEQRLAVSRAIAKGAKVCPECKREPLGMEQPTGTGQPDYEIGCRSCTGRRVRLRTREAAVKAWNAGRYVVEKTRAGHVVGESVPVPVTVWRTPRWVPFAVAAACALGAAAGQWLW